MKRLNLVNVLRYIIGIGVMVGLCWHWVEMGFLVGMIIFIFCTDGCELPIFRREK